MKRINLKDYYPYYKTDVFCEISDDVAELLEMFGREENAYNRKKYRYKAHYSLDFHEAVEHGILFSVRSPEEIYERKLTCEQLHQAMATLPDKQAKRIYAHYFLGMSKTDIASAEKVSESTVRESISRGLKNLEKYLKKFF